MLDCRASRTCVASSCGAPAGISRPGPLGFLRYLGTAPAQKISISPGHDGSNRWACRFPRPTVAIIRGGCFGGGVGIAAACDIAIAAEDAVFAISEVRWGITAAPIIPLLVDRLGPRALGRLALTGERFGAAEALRIGLVHQIHPASGLEAAAAQIVDNLLMAAPEAAAMTKG